VGILARAPPLGKPQRGNPVRGSTVDGVIGCPAGDERGGPVCGTGGGTGRGGGVGTDPLGKPDDEDGRPVRGSVWGWLLGSPLRGSIVDGTPTGGLGVSVGDCVPVADGELDRVPGSGGELAPVCARAGAAASSTPPSVSSAAVRV
jgi:hypothetical protein